MRNKKKVLSVVGARPQFIKAAVVSRQIQHSEILREVLIHTGQHYDEKMSATFFEELDLPHPDVNLEVGSHSQAVQTAQMMERLEPVLARERPDIVLIYGDTNSTLAGALTAVKMHIPTAHVEAGLRSFNQAMPEEINRLVADSVSDLLFAPTSQSELNLQRESVHGTVLRVGDVMYDSFLLFEAKSESCSPEVESLVSDVDGYALVTIHRAENTDGVECLTRILAALAYSGEPMIFPVHPRCRKVMEASRLAFPENVVAIDPVGYLDMLFLERNAFAVLTDSGGVQKEAFFFGVPCVTLRGETEWVETVEAGYNRIVGVDSDGICRAVKAARAGEFLPEERVFPGSLYGDGHAGERIVRELETFLG